MDKISRVCGIDPFHGGVSAGNGFPPLHFVPTLQHAGTKRLLSIDHEQIILQPCNVAMIEQGPAAGRSATPVGTSEADQNRQWLAKKGFSQLATSDILAVFFVLQTRET